jgi:uncharacterized phiE125 gp8 family phage protein
MIKAAVAALEKYTDQKFVSQVWLQYMDRFPMNYSKDWWDGVKEMPTTELYSPCNDIVLLTGPLRSLISFKTYADDGVGVAFDPSNYVLDLSGQKGRIALKIGAVWPTTILRRLNGIEIEFEVGMAADAAGVPHEVKQAVLEYVSVLYENRGDEKPAIPVSALSLVEPHRIFKAGLNA